MSASLKSVHFSETWSSWAFCIFVEKQQHYYILQCVPKNYGTHFWYLIRESPNNNSRPMFKFHTHKPDPYFLPLKHLLIPY